MTKTPKDVFKFTIAKIEKLPSPIKGRKYYRDTEEKGLQLYVTVTGVKTFCYRKKINGKSHIITFGQFGEISINSARKKCAKTKVEISEQSDYFEQKNSNKENQKIDEAVLEYISLHSELHKSAKQVKTERRYLELHLSDIAQDRVVTLTKESLIKLHRNITKKSGPYAANRVMAFIRSMYNWKIEVQGWGISNPASKIKFNREIKRDRFLQKNEKERFIKALDEEPNEIARDFFFASILTGARKGNVLAMKWEQIDFEQGIWRIPKTKNHDAHNVPLLDEVIKILNRRKLRNPVLGFTDSPFVFPSAKSASGHFEEPKSAWKRILERAEIEKLTIHDLRRTMGSYMTMQGTNIQTVGKVLGHKHPEATLIYSRLDVDTARKAMEDAASEILN